MVKVSLLRLGIVVLRVIIGVSTPPSVFDAERQRRHVEQLDVGRRAEEQLRALDRRADGDDLVRVHALVPLLAEDLLHQLLHARHAGHAADHHDFVDLVRLAAWRP